MPAVSSADGFQAQKCSLRARRRWRGLARRARVHGSAARIQRVSVVIGTRIPVKSACRVPRIFTLTLYEIYEDIEPSRAREVAFSGIKEDSRHSAPVPYGVNHLSLSSKITVTVAGAGIRCTRYRFVGTRLAADVPADWAALGTSLAWCRAA